MTDNFFLEKFFLTKKGLLILELKLLCLAARENDFSVLKDTKSTYVIHMHVGMYIVQAFLSNTGTHAGNTKE